MSQKPVIWAAKRPWASLLAGGLLALLTACSGGGSDVGAKASETTGNASPAAPAAAVLKPLKAEPEKGPVGTAFTVKGEGLAAGADVELAWASSEGSYVTDVVSGSIDFEKTVYTQKKLSIGKAKTDAEGRFTAAVTVPESYGEVHDIVALVDGQEVAKGGFYVNRIANISPLKGPVGTPITIDVKGLGTGFESLVSVRWDNSYVGFMSSTTTGGTAKAVIRAAGPPGKHFIEIEPASAAVPYLNPEQTLTRRNKLPQFRLEFTVTEDAGAPGPSVEWPESSRVAAVPTLPLTAKGAPSLAAGSQVSVALSPSSGPILSKATLSVTGLSPQTTLDPVWMTVTGSRRAGWSGTDLSLGKATADGSGSLTTAVEIPEGLGGWHTIVLFQGDQALAEVPYYVERSLVGVTPTTVKLGETFKVQIKGIGWTELDNGLAITYDNSYVGYACGFASGGDITVELTATGAPGTHLIDIYPMIYNGGFIQHENWNYQVPQLTFAQDQAGLALGYRIPVYRLAITAVE